MFYKDIIKWLVLNIVYIFFVVKYIIVMCVGVSCFGDECKYVFVSFVVSIIWYFV